MILADTEEQPLETKRNKNINPVRLYDIFYLNIRTHLSTAFINRAWNMLLS